MGTKTIKKEEKKLDTPKKKAAARMSKEQRHLERPGHASSPEDNDDQWH